MASLDPVADIKDRLPVESLVGDYLVLKRAGINFKGLCPFHQEKTPSFMVSPERRSWHCFGCSKGGDIFTFVMEMEGLQFKEALQLLARKTGVELPQRSFDRTTSSRNQRLIEINTAAMEFFEQALRADTPEAAHARDELQRRKVDQLTRGTFHVGFAPSGAGASSWTQLTEYLSKKGFSDTDAVAAGVAVARLGGRRGVYDRFRNRLTFPLIDVVGRTVGFSARALDPDEKMGKYINSPESPIYHKGNFLFALSQAKHEIRQRGFVVLVEGQMDAVSSHRVGVKNVVATSGTALTEQQLALLKRYSSNVILAFDVDIAGSSATKRGIDLALAQGFNVKVARMPSAADPDDLCRESPEAWGAALTNSERIIDYYIRRATEGQDLGTVEVKKSVARTVLPELIRLTDPVEQAHYLQRLATLLRVDESVLRAAITTTGQSRARRSQSADRTAVPPAGMSTVAPDPLRRKMARLVALRIHGEPVQEDMLAPLRALDAQWIRQIHSLLVAGHSGKALLDAVRGVDQAVARLVDAELFALEQELGSAEETSSTKEIVELVKVIARQGLRQELTQLHLSNRGSPSDTSSPTANAQTKSQAELAERFAQKTRELAKLDQ